MGYGLDFSSFFDFFHVFTSQFLPEHQGGASNDDQRPECWHAATSKMAAHHNDKLDKALGSRNCCVIGLCAAWVTGVAGIAGGCYCIYLNHYSKDGDGSGAQFLIPHAAKEVLPLGMNVIVTFLNEAMGYIHSTSLRWSLQYENRLTFNSNLRLLSSAKRSKPNTWYCNMLFLVCIILSYATTSLIFLGYNTSLGRTMDTEATAATDMKLENIIHVSGIALIIFGISLLGQAGLSTWALMGTKIPTWSSNPLDTVYACTDDTNPNQLVRRKDRCMKSVHDITQDSYPVAPKEKQGPACTAHPEVKWVLTLLWALVPLGAVWGGATYIMILKGNPHGVLGDSWTFIPLFTGSTYNSTISTSCEAARCTHGTSVLNVGWTANSGIIGNVGSIFLIAGFQAGLTLALHCAELLVNLSRDEGIFRMAITPKGTDPRYNSIVAAFSSWQTIMLFGFKAAVHWLFGLAINNDFKLGVNMYPPQVFYFTAFAFGVAVFASYVSLRRPMGPLPATFGHLQTMADLIDEWDDRMFWGHKENGFPNYAGTSSKRLDMPRWHELYGGVGSLNAAKMGAARPAMGNTAWGTSEETLAAEYHMGSYGSGPYVQVPPYGQGPYGGGGMYNQY
ncbi:uncharacterized protein PAC_03609 [Phialocephala subalpina]|uniref:Uncharacterized protein n=1 Tax=Phialocephala subalpina TaxID=576137 RepID=A0A1L7WLT5_9HELO|nr:uncharacterized protein PAC_03609 [Phialocephala subalpina]